MKLYRIESYVTVLCFPVLSALTRADLHVLCKNYYPHVLSTARSEVNSLSLDRILRNYGVLSSPWRADARSPLIRVCTDQCSSADKAASSYPRGLRSLKLERIESYLTVSRFPLLAMINRRANAQTHARTVQKLSSCSFDRKV